MVHKLSLLLAKQLATYVGWQKKTDIIAYGFELIIGEALKFVLLLFISAYFGILMPTVLILATAIPLRLVSGGGHCKTYARCTLLTVSVYFFLAVLANWLIPDFNSKTFIVILPLLIITSFTVIHLWVPGENPNRFFTQNERTKFRNLSRLLILLWSAICVLFYCILSGFTFKVFFVSTAIGVGWQTFFVSPLGYWLIHSVEKLFDLFTNAKEVS